MKDKIKIGNAQAFWGDDETAAATLLRQQPDLDFITLDYLSEVSMSIMAIQREKDPEAGYAKDFVNVIKSLIPFWKKGSKVKVIANAGGLEPMKCAKACTQLLLQEECSHLRLAVVSGDNVINQIKNDPTNSTFNNMDDAQPIQKVIDRLITANVYLGAASIAQALDAGADIVITGRVADPSLTVAPCLSHFKWSLSDYDPIAQATLAGHLIECGTQVTGGISTNWLDLPLPAQIGFPFVTMQANGEFTISKPAAAQGAVTIETVKEQILYEIGDPHAYMSPDVIMSILNVSLQPVAEGIKILGAKGRAPSPYYKVSATYADGYKAEGTLSIFGEKVKEKAQRCGKIVLERLKLAGYEPEQYNVECLGTGDLVPGITNVEDTLECVLRISVADHRKAVLECFAKQIAPLVTSGPQGTTGYTSGRPHIRPIFGFWPCLISRDLVTPKVELVEVKK